MKDPIGDRLKAYEAAAEVYLDPKLPIIMRLDGKSFHTWTKCLTRPYDVRLTALMNSTMTRLGHEFGARYIYTQSDEMTLVIYVEGDSQVPFSGRAQKMCSVAASIAAGHFNGALVNFGVVSPKLAAFDCRVYNVPSKAEAAAVVLWREADAIRNSTQARGQESLSPNQLHGLSSRKICEKLIELDQAWGALPRERKFGTAYAKRRVKARYSAEERESLPLKHEGRWNGDLLVERQMYVGVPMPLRWTCANPEEVIFDGALPTTLEASKEEEEP